MAHGILSHPSSTFWDGRATMWNPLGPRGLRVLFCRICHTGILSLGGCRCSRGSHVAAPPSQNVLEMVAEDSGGHPFPLPSPLWGLSSGNPNPRRPLLVLGDPLPKGNCGRGSRGSPSAPSIPSVGSLQRESQPKAAAAGSGGSSAQRNCGRGSRGSRISTSIPLYGVSAEGIPSPGSRRPPVPPPADPWSLHLQTPGSSTCRPPVPPPADPRSPGRCRCPRAAPRRRRRRSGAVGGASPDRKSVV